MKTGKKKNRGLWVILALFLFFLFLRKQSQKATVVKSLPPPYIPEFTGGGYTLSSPTTPPPTTSEGGETLTFEFTNLTDQTFTHNLGRLVDVTTIVGGEEVELNVLYPDLNTVRIQSNTAITGTLIVQ